MIEGTPAEVVHEVSEQVSDDQRPRRIRPRRPRAKPDAEASATDGEQATVQPAGGDDDTMVAAE